MTGEHSPGGCSSICCRGCCPEMHQICCSISAAEPELARCNDQAPCQWHCCCSIHSSWWWLAGCHVKNAHWRLEVGITAFHLAGTILEEAVGTASCVMTDKPRKAWTGQAGKVSLRDWTLCFVSVLADLKRQAYSSCLTSQRTLTASSDPPGISSNLLPSVCHATHFGIMASANSVDNIHDLHS